MATNIIIPSVGESVSEGTISRWLKKDGDQVRQGEPLVEVETEKATTEIPAPAAGTLRIKTAEGQTIQVGATIGVIEEAAAVGAPSAPEKQRPFSREPVASAKRDTPKKASPEGATAPEPKRQPEKRAPAAAAQEKQQEKQQAALVQQPEPIEPEAMAEMQPKSVAAPAREPPPPAPAARRLAAGEQ